MLETGVIIFLLSCFIVCYTIYKIIYISHKKHLFDEPYEKRKIHHVRTPNLGGVAIYITILFIGASFSSFHHIEQLNFLLCGSLILFAMGFTDDLVGVDHKKKLITQIIVSLLIPIVSGYRISSLYEIFGLDNLPLPVSIFISASFILFLINSFNLIDGINWLAGGIGLFITAVLAIAFWNLGETAFYYLAMAIGGALAGFLWYNKTPAKIFMGDTGSYFLGYAIAIMCIRLINLSAAGENKISWLTPKNIVPMLFALLIVPFFDTIRIILVRISNGRSPFRADRNHIHHKLLDLQFNHLQASFSLIGITAFPVCAVLVFPGIPAELHMLLSCIYAFCMLGLLWFKSRKLKTRKRSGRKTEEVREIYPSRELNAV